MSFSIKNIPNTLLSRNSNVLTNGTFLKHDMLPRIGYPFVERERSLEDTLTHQYSYFHRDAHKVHVHTIMRVPADQIAIAPGKQLSVYPEHDKLRYEYKTESPVKFNFSFHSGRFAVRSEEYLGKKISLYYVPGHEHNTGLMLDGLKASLDYNTSIFGPYPHDDIRIIEFPHTEESYSATLTANNIPSSEVLFNINMDAMEDKINLPFYVMAHELTHEWFGNQVMPADAEGAKMLTESITEYLSLQIYQKHFGEEMADRFLEAQKDRYARGKRSEKEPERSLHRVLSHQEYLAYGKGALAFQAIAETIGTDVLLKAFSSYLMAYDDCPDYYPTSLELIHLLVQNAGAQDHNTIRQWLMEPGMND